MNRRHVHAAERINKVLAIGRILNTVRSITLGECHQFCAVKINPVIMNEVRILSGIPAAGAKPDLSLLFINQIDPAHNPFAPGNLLPDLPGLGIDQI
jgi:hypothetical protein